MTRIAIIGAGAIGSALRHFINMPFARSHCVRDIRRTRDANANLQNRGLLVLRDC